MTARKLARVFGMAVLALGAGLHPATAEPWQTFDWNDGYLAGQFVEARAGEREPKGVVTDDLAPRYLDDGGLRGLWPELTGPIVPYAGFGLGKINVAMDLETGEVDLEKEKRFTRARLILGMAYPVSNSVSLGMEYHAVASDDPLFSLDMGGQSLEFDTKFTTHFLNLNVRYEF